MAIVQYNAVTFQFTAKLHNTLNALYAKGVFSTLYEEKYEFFNQRGLTGKKR